jgi:hypothetical protein
MNEAAKPWPFRHDIEQEDIAAGGVGEGVAVA